MRILRDDCLCLVVDVQEKLVPAMHDQAAVLDRIRLLIEGCKLLGLPFLLTEQYPKGLGPTVAAVRGLLPDAPALAKTSFSCCDDPAFMEALRGLEQSTVLVCGMETHVCVQQTVTDLCALGFAPVVVADCVASRQPAERDLGLRRMEREGAIVSSAESILFELTRAAGGDLFKAVSKLVK